jgi:retron-type reverse transcriptase
MSNDLGLLPSHLELIIRTAPLRYKKFSIPKRDGSLREVAQPAREVKAIQRWIVSELRNHLPIHPSATAYEKGSSIIRNAGAHRKGRFILKMDFKDFFPSIQYGDLSRHLERYCADIYDDAERKQLIFSCMWVPARKPPLRLCIGAPSSPFISNSILHDFDTEISKQAHTDGVIYTRYADDLTFSSVKRDVLGKYPGYIKRSLLALKSPKLIINTKKTVHASRAGKRVVTGLVLTPEGHLSVGRERKRLVRAMFHQYYIGELSEDKVQTLQGLLAFIDSVEPGFSDKLINRYARR